MLCSLGPKQNYGPDHVTGEKWGVRGRILVTQEGQSRDGEKDCQGVPLALPMRWLPPAVLLV